MKRILLFDTIIDGHHADYLTHLVTYWLDHPSADELVVVAQAAFEPVFDRLCAAQRGPASRGPARPDTRQTVRFVAIPPARIDAVHGASSLRRSFAEWNLCRYYIREYQPTHTLLMYFDLFQLAIGLGRRTSCMVSGIYFRPDFHYGTPSGLKARLNALRKKLTLLGMLRRGAVTNLFCLDHSAVAALRQISPGVNVLPLPDPVESYSIPAAEISELRRTLQIELGRRVFLLFGSLDERKGIEPLLDALDQLPPARQADVCLLLVGSIKPDFRQRIDARIADVSADVQIVRVFEEVKGQAIQAYFDLCDYALALYQRHVGMASVVVRAAVSGKPLLASDYGYLGQVVQTNQLGVVADSTSPDAIRHLLDRVLTEGVPHSVPNLNALAEANSDTAFAKTIFDHL